MTDTSEYWEDVKRNYPYTGKQFTHMINSKCGHINPMTGNTVVSQYLGDVNCYACLKLIKQTGNIYGLIDGMSPKKKSKIDKLKHIQRLGKCGCGGYKYSD